MNSNSVSGWPSRNLHCARARPERVVDRAGSCERTSVYDTSEATAIAAATAAADDEYETCSESSRLAQNVTDAAHGLDQARLAVASVFRRR